MAIADETRPPAITKGQRAATLVLAGLTLASALSFAGELWWVFDLLAHFHAIYLFLATLLAAGLLALRGWKLAAWAAALAVFEAMLVLPLYLGAEAPDPAAPRLRVVEYNVFHDNPRSAEAARHIAALAPDVVVLLEITPAQLQVFTAALPGWYHVARPREDAFGIAVFTREPPSTTRMLELGPPWMPSIEVTLELAGQTVAVAAVHPPPPVSAAHSETRNELLRAVSSWAAAHQGPALVVGDLNATPWSVAMREILASGPLRSTQRFGVQGTWPSFLGPLSLPIDHVLYTTPLYPVARTIEPAFGSDHRMLYAELELR
jgi:endonuclease/exonuclease/phosphatase (EEP) superfamily protein YafD